MASTSTSPKQEPVSIPLPLPLPLPEPHPQPQAHSTPLAIATVASPNPETPSYEPPMGVPLPLLLTAPPATRRLPPPCWTPDETSVLIDAYRVKWYSLRRGNLRAAHWQDVADQIHSACPDVLPPKTSVQCRHKMEKLRKRYRAELLRAKSIPHHSFSSSWLYFSRMDAMEKNIDVPAVASLPSPQPLSYAPSVDPTPPPRYSTTPHLQHQHQHQHQHLDNHNDDANDDDDADDDDDEEEGFTPHSQPIYLQPKAAFATPTYQHPDPHRIRPSSNPRTGATFAAFNDSPSPNFKTAYAHKTTSYGAPPHYNGARFVNNHDANNNATPGPGPSRMGMAMKMDMNYMHVNSSTGGDTMKKKKKKRKMNNGREERRERAKDKGDEAGMEMVEAIRMLGEGFVRMEKMKMEMIRETERMRMDMEMKRTQMLLDSQHRIVEAFAKGWSDVINNNNKNDDAHQDDAS